MLWGRKGVRQCVGISKENGKAVRWERKRLPMSKEPEVQLRGRVFAQHSHSLGFDGSTEECGCGRGALGRR